MSDPGKVEGNPVFVYLDAFYKEGQFERYLPEYQNLDELKAHYRREASVTLRLKVPNSVLQEELEPIRNRRKEYEKDIPYIMRY